MSDNLIVSVNRSFPTADNQAASTVDTVDFNASTVNVDNQWNDTANTFTPDADGEYLFEAVLLGVEPTAATVDCYAVEGSNYRLIGRSTPTPVVDGSGVEFKHSLCVIVSWSEYLTTSQSVSIATYSTAAHTIAPTSSLRIRKL